MKGENMVGGNGIGTSNPSVGTRGTSNPKGIDSVVSHASGVIQTSETEDKATEQLTEQLEEEEARLLDETDKGLAIKILGAKGKSDAEIEVELQTKYNAPESIRDFVASNHAILQEANF